MTPQECYERASKCAANAALATDQPVSQEFSNLADQWRAMAVRALFLGQIGEAVTPLER